MGPATKIVSHGGAGVPGGSAFPARRVSKRARKKLLHHTVEKVRAMGEEPYFIIGADAFAEIASWHRWRDLIRSTEFIVVTRPGHDYTAPEGARVHRFDTVALPVSSSDIRRRLGLGEIPPALPERWLLTSPKKACISSRAGRRGAKPRHQLNLGRRRPSACGASSGMPLVATKYFGKMSHLDESVFDFPFGLPAFEKEKKFVFIESPTTRLWCFCRAQGRPDLFSGASDPAVEAD